MTESTTYYVIDEYVEQLEVNKWDDISSVTEVEDQKTGQIKKAASSMTF